MRKFDEWMINLVIKRTNWFYFADVRVLNTVSTTSHSKLIISCSYFLIYQIILFVTSLVFSDVVLHWDEALTQMWGSIDNEYAVLSTAAPDVSTLSQNVNDRWEVPHLCQAGFASRWDLRTNYLTVVPFMEKIVISLSFFDLSLSISVSLFFLSQSYILSLSFTHCLPLSLSLSLP